MDDIKLRLNASVASQLSAAAPSDAKDELIEELSDNLYRRFLDMTSAGMEEEAAFNRALEDLGDVDELLSYLGVESVNMNITISPEGAPTRIETKDGKTFTVTPEGGEYHFEVKDGQNIVVNLNDDGERIIINHGGESGTTREEAKAAREEAETAHKEADSAKEAAEGRDRQYHCNQPPQSDLDAILANVSEMCRIAMDQAKEAVRQAKDAVQRRTTWEKDDGHVRVHFNTHPNDPVPTPPTPPTPPVPPEPPAPPTPPNSNGWEFEAELDTDQGRFFAGAGPKEKKDVVYGFGYDKTKGGFFTQWGEYQSEGQEHRGPHFTGEDSFMEHQDDGSYSVTALRDLRGIEVFTVAGDVAIHVSEAPDAGVIIDGDVDELDVTCSADGVLTIREGRTASSSFFSRRGFCSADVELYLPRRHWEMISVSTTSGDVDIDRDGLNIGQLSVNTMSGDLTARLRACTQLCFKSASGDLELEGRCTELRAETMSGDINLRGQVENAFLKSASGDLELEGEAARFLAHSVSGDVHLETSALPQAMELSSKSGDCEARIPDAGPFRLRMKTVSGEMRCDFPINYIDGMCVYGDGSGPAYSMTTVSGDISLERH